MITKFRIEHPVLWGLGAVALCFGALRGGLLLYAVNPTLAMMLLFIGMIWLAWFKPDFAAVGILFASVKFGGVAALVGGPLIFLAALRWRALTAKSYAAPTSTSWTQKAKTAMRPSDPVRSYGGFFLALLLSLLFASLLFSLPNSGGGFSGPPAGVRSGDGPGMPDWLARSIGWILGHLPGGTGAPGGECRPNPLMSTGG